MDAQLRHQFVAEAEVFSVFLAALIQIAGEHTEIGIAQQEDDQWIEHLAQALGKDAVDVAKIITDDKAEWFYIPKEVGEIAEKKWDENQALLRAAADTVIKMSKTSGMRHFDAAGLATIDAYLSTDAGTVDDIWAEAAGETGYWSDYAKRALYAYVNGESMRNGLGRG